MLSRNVPAVAGTRSFFYSERYDRFNDPKETQKCEACEESLDKNDKHSVFFGRERNHSDEARDYYYGGPL